MALVDFVMPTLGDSMTEGTINLWLKVVGDPVKEGEPLAEIGTDKVDTEVASPVTGVLHQILAEADSDVPCGRPIAVIRTD